MNDHQSKPTWQEQLAIGYRTGIGKRLGCG
jgi:hypothetical protein